jgi:LysM repeat protein
MRNEMNRLTPLVGTMFAIVLVSIGVFGSGVLKAADSGPSAHAKGPYDASTNSYTVVAGDELSYIAKRFGTTAAKLEELNGMTADVIAAGNKLIVYAGNIRGDATGPTTAKGYDHLEQSLTMKDVKPADNMYPVLQRPEQLKAAQAKLAALQKKTGKKPNIFIFLMDDTGYMDPGFNGGGTAVGNATPSMDKFAYEGLVLSSAYTTPSCSPTRSTIHTGQNPLHHGILRPPMYGEPGGLDGATTMPDLLKKAGVHHPRRRQVAHG